jgi:hypothetical protein
MRPKPDIAFLVYAPLRQRRQNNSFDGNTNIGAFVVQDILERAGYAVGFCSVATARNYRLVLVSLTSTYDVYAYYRTVALHPDWQRGQRAFTVLGGGFGMQNPTTIRYYLDVAAFGRVETFLVPLVEALLEGRPYEHASVMHLPDLTPVTIAQATTLYPHAVQVGTFRFVEEFTGCPLKCKFCHYTYAREHQVVEGQDQHAYVQNTLSMGNTPEVTWDQVQTYPRKAGRLRVAIDGFSQRLRYLYGKRIGTADIVQGIEHIGSFAGVTVLLVYNIANFPGETAEDRAELYAALQQARPRHRVIFVLHSTPFRPSLATPMQWEGVSLSPDWSSVSTKVITEHATLRAVHSFTLETAYSHLLAVIAERATPAQDGLFHALCYARQLQTGTGASRLRRLQAHFETSFALREYDLEEQPPAWFVQGWMETERLRAMARRMREQRQRMQEEPGWLPGGATLLDGVTLRERRAARRSVPS